MRDDDGRKLDHQLLEHLRMKAVRDVAAGAHPEQVARALGLHRKTVYRWVARYRRNGTAGLRSTPPSGRPPKLSDQHLRRLLAVLLDGDPRDLRFDVALWTRQVVRLVIRREFDVTLSEASIGRVLDRMGLPTGRPPAHPAQPAPDIAARWIHEELPNVRMAAEVNGATLYFCTEAPVGGPRTAGDPVTADAGTATRTAHMISVVTTKGMLRFAVYGGSPGAGTFIDFCRRLLHDAAHPAYLVVDGQAAVRSAQTQRYVASTCGRLRLFVLPAGRCQRNCSER